MSKLYGQDIYQCGRYEAVGWEKKCKRKEGWTPETKGVNAWTPANEPKETWTPEPPQTADYIP